MHTKISTHDLRKIAQQQRLARKRRNIEAMHRIGRSLRG